MSTEKVVRTCQSLRYIVADENMWQLENQDFDHIRINLGIRTSKQLGHRLCGGGGEQQQPTG